MLINNGVDFEEEVFNTITHLVESGKLGLIASNCKVFHHKKYFSKDRNANIITDVSIELSIDDVAEPYFIWVWECKDYRHGIPIDDIEEFHSKLEQIGADKTKGTIITSSGYFQQGCLAYAKSKGIGLARLMPSSQVHFVLACMSKNSTYRDITSDALTIQDFLSCNENFFVKDEFAWGYSFESYISDVLNRINRR